MLSLALKKTLVGLSSVRQSDLGWGGVWVSEWVSEEASKAKQASKTQYTYWGQRKRSVLKKKPPQLWVNEWGRETVSECIYTHIHIHTYCIYYILYMQLPLFLQSVSQGSVCGVCVEKQARAPPGSKSKSGEEEENIFSHASSNLKILF